MACYAAFHGNLIFKPMKQIANIKKIKRLSAVALLLSFLFSCSLQNKLERDEYLLQEQEIKLQGDYPAKLTRSLDDYYQQSENSRMLIKEWMYTTLHTEEDKKLRNWISKGLGAKPVIYDRFQTKKTNRQFELYLKNQGYLNAEVRDTVMYNGKKVEVHYLVAPKRIYRIDTITYTILDTTVQKIFHERKKASLIKPGASIKVSTLKDERSRIADLMKENGYFYFNKQYVNYVIDTIHYKNRLKLNLQIKTPKGQPEGHTRYRIDSVLIYPNYDPNQALRQGQSYFNQFDTLHYAINKRMLFLKTGHYHMRQSALMHENFIFTDSLYRKSVTERTYRQLLGLGTFKFVNIDYKKSERKNPDKSGEYLNCYIQLTPMVKQSYSVNVEGTNTSGNFGVAGNLTYEHKNFFKGAEMFNFSLKGAQEAQGDIVENEEDQNNIQLFNTQEYGVETQIEIPRFLFPFLKTSYSRKYNPFTNISLAYNYQRRPDYTRAIANTSFGYVWSSPGNLMMKHYLDPVQLNIVSVSNESAGFLEDIENPYIRNSYENQLLFSATYNLVYDNKEKKELRDHFYLRLNLESSGNLLNLASDLFNAERVDGFYEVSGIRYAQFFKTNFDFRYYHTMDKRNKLVYRLFAGIAYPYGNSNNSTPFIKKYYSGGANSLRAWPVRGVGPGTYSGEISGINNQLGDIKLEANMEYRFDLFWLIEGALFVDAGNIWELPKSAGNESPAFKWNNFYKGIAVGTGFGARFDLSFFILRLDFGLKLRNPARPENKRWLPGNKQYRFSDVTLNFGISYPF